MPTPRTPLPRAALQAVGEAQEAAREAAQLLRGLLREQPHTTDLAAALALLALTETRLSEARQSGKGGAAAPIVSGRRAIRGGPMNRTQEERLKTSLTKALERWLEEGGLSDDGAPLPYVGGDIAEIMAGAAFAVLRGIADAQGYLEQEGMLKDDD
jgi:hypothetical protein